MNDDKSNNPEYTDKESKTSETNEARADTDSDGKPSTHGKAFRKYRQQLTSTRGIKSFDPSNPPPGRKAIKSVPPSKNEPKDKVDDE